MSKERNDSLTAVILEVELFCIPLNERLNKSIYTECTTQELIEYLEKILPMFLSAAKRLSQEGRI